MQDHYPGHTDRYVAARTNGGWPAAAATIVFALILIGSATVIHMRTYKPPTDPSWRAAGQAPAAEVPRGH
jgi:hypothetical protein